MNRLVWSSALKKCALFALVIATASCSQDDSGVVIATVGDKKITQQQFDDYLVLKRIDKNRMDVVERHKEEFLRREALALAIEQHAAAGKNNLDMKKINAELNESRKDVLMGRYFEQYLNEQVSEEAVGNYYTANAEKYESKKVQVSHILVRVKAQATEQERQAKYTLAHQIHSELQSGESFESLVEKYSEDAISKKRAGGLGWISEGAIGPEFAKQAFEVLKAGQTSEPVMTQFGYHLVRLDEGPAVIKSHFNKVKGDIRYQLRKNAKDAEIERLLKATPVAQK
ncbi:peptidylprolyl isomerase [uncultured Microbulbifer sp.]|uniref:peptidylprolyl isomerase n=1 Tax=uncultured Microbulbifer sp. TaxID=348147 RepID=UPI0026250C5A|nr:peptidylprolyl isomerase [uncultured Microbulbifer sp.]